MTITIGDVAVLERRLETALYTGDYELYGEGRLSPKQALELIALINLLYKDKQRLDWLANSEDTEEYSSVWAGWDDSRENFRSCIDSAMKLYSA